MHLALLLAATLAQASSESDLGHERLTATLKGLVEGHPDTFAMAPLAKTAQGRDVWMVEFGAPPGTARKPTLLVIANIEGELIIGSRIALGLAQRLAAGGPEASKILNRVAVRIVPRLNPDGAERLLTAPRLEVRGNIRPLDRDRDGREGEDGPDDLNGDGLITTMRIHDPVKGTLVPDRDDPRILRPADPSKGERGEWLEMSEGIDNDADGLINEDPPTGIHLGRNFPQGWTEYDPEAGRYPGSEPETYALLRHAYDHPEIAAIWSLGLADNLREEPKGQGVEEADKPLFVDLHRRWSQAAELPPPPDAKDGKPRRPCGDGPATGGTSDGALHEWAYHQFGIPGLATRPWTTPVLDLGPDAKLPEHGEARWLLWNDRVQGGREFLPFVKVNHPKYDEVLVGGWRPGAKLNPPDALVEDLVEVHWRFLRELAERRADLKWGEVKVEPRGGNLFQITAEVINDGAWPTALAKGVQTRQAAPVRVKLDHGPSRLLGGKGRHLIDRIEGGGRREFRWLVQTDDATTEVTLDVSSPKAGGEARTLKLETPRP